MATKTQDLPHAKHKVYDNSGNKITVKNLVEGWNWNMNIFEIYDEIKQWQDSDNRKVLRYAYLYFGKDDVISDLALHLTGQGVK